jgi:hypothetical protein
MKRHVITILVTFLLLGAVIGRQEAHAATGVVFHYPSADAAGAQCWQTLLGFSWSVTGQTDDLAGYDHIAIVIRDANGVLLNYYQLWFPVGGTQAAGGYTYYYTGMNNITARPVTLSFIDIGAAYTINGTPFSSFTIDPAAWSPSCQSIPLKYNFWDPGDDRLNRDPGQPAALYCRNGGDLQVWQVDAVTSRGTLALIIAKAEIAKVKDSHPAKNTLIKASKDGRFKLYYLPGSDELSFITTYLNSDKVYAFVFKGCS